MMGHGLCFINLSNLVGIVVENVNATVFNLLKEIVFLILIKEYMVL